jgi:hypothetical protein
MRLDAAAMRDTERERLRSLVHADMKAAGALHAEDYQLITPRGYALSKQEYLGRIASGRLRYRVFEPASDIAVRGSGDVALVRGRRRRSRVPHHLLAHRLLRVARRALAGRLVAGHRHQPGVTRQGGRAS